MVSQVGAPAGAAGIVDGASGVLGAGGVQAVGSGAAGVEVGIAGASGVVGAKGRNNFKTDPYWRDKVVAFYDEQSARDDKRLGWCDIFELNDRIDNELIVFDVQRVGWYGTFMALDVENAERLRDRLNQFIAARKL
jgi:hypothetical protein